MSKVLLIGSGAPEHALSFKLTISADVSHIFVSPGNAGTERLGPKVSNVCKYEEITNSCRCLPCTTMMEK